ncbi:MAG: 23S rRNA (adenine(1618)-N(6))-methyltransferase RlmF [Azonexus sp.]|nr:23S rRNA (adenine(1618)-N(6))-methyltransferase RlmF [Azonexus sp.]MDZ4314900.1 23S rRNA (adenine(1618)-N(6))-methyltransferase RlmF [Azonexus sp.]
MSETTAPESPPPAPPIKKKPTPAKPPQATLHPRNKNVAGYDFAALTAVAPGLVKYVITTAAGTPSIDFANPGAVKAFNRALLALHYGVRGWEIPAGYLCPPIPGRADYIHQIADLLATCNKKIVPTGADVRILDIGVGANCIYPLIGHAEYGWRFLGVDIDEAALANAQMILSKNSQLTAAVELRHQTVWDNVFTGLLRSGETFDASICNPPFHNSPDEVLAVSQRKWNNLNKPGAKRGAAQPRLNFGGGGTELWCNGGERAFVKRMIEQSAAIPKRVMWFTSLVSKAENLEHIELALKKVHVADSRIIAMGQGQKQSRLVAWTFTGNGEREKWRKLRWSLASSEPTETPSAFVDPV